MLYERTGHIQLTASPDSLDFDELPTRYSVPYTCLGQRVYVLHDDKGRLLQGDDAQVVVVWLTVWKGLVPWPHSVPQAQGVVFPLAHLHHKDKATPVLSCTTDFEKDESLSVTGTGEEPHPSMGFGATYLRAYVLRKMEIKGKQNTGHAPCPGLSPD